MLPAEVIYLVDNSAWALLPFNKAASARFGELVREAEVATCPVVAGELLFSARNHDELRQQRYQLEKLLWLETTEDASLRALGVQQDMAKRGHHRGINIVDFMVAATAEAHWATVLHYDSDFERIAEVTGQPHEWIVPRGEGHGKTD